MAFECAQLAQHSAQELAFPYLVGGLLNFILFGVDFHYFFVLQIENSPVQIINGLSLVLELLMGQCGVVQRGEYEVRLL